MRLRILLIAYWSLTVLRSAQALPADCLVLDGHSPHDLPAGQLAAPVTGPLTQAERSRHHFALPPGPLDSVTMSLDRGACLGVCPIYSIRIDGDGSASYEGREFVLVKGHHDFKLAKADVRCLLDQFRNADFWALADDYVADVTDAPKYRVTLKIGGETKSVVDYFGSSVGMPEIITALENEIDHLAADRWTLGNADTLPSLRGENFDFRSPAAAVILANAAARAPDDLILGLLEAGTSATGRSSFPGQMQGPTAVELASRAGRRSIVEALVAKGAFSKGPPHIKDAVLRGAAASGNARLVADVLKAGPDVNGQDREGRTALANIWESHRYPRKNVEPDLVAIAHLLLNAGADPNVADNSGNTALFSASDPIVVRMLIGAGAKIEVRNKYGATPLLYADSDEAAVALIDAGADTTVTDKTGDTVEARAEKKGFIRTQQLLQERRLER